MAIQQLDKVTQQNTSAAEQLSATSEELASQADQLKSVISYFRISGGTQDTGRSMSSKVRQEIAQRAPHMKKATTDKSASRVRGGGFDLDLEAGDDDLDKEFAKRPAA